MSRLETGFRDVDAAGDAKSYVDYLSHVNGLESGRVRQAGADTTARSAR
jgi:hypothetical protein